MRKMAVATRSIEDEMGAEREFHYHLIIDMEETEHFACENYGISVTEQGGESVTVRGITLRADRIDELLTLLVDGAVSPTVAQDIVADWL